MDYCRKWFFCIFLHPDETLQLMGIPNWSNLTTLRSFGEALSPRSSLIRSYLIAVGIGILHPSKLNLPDALTALWTLIKSPKSHLHPPIPLTCSMLPTLTWWPVARGILMGRRSVILSGFASFSARPADMPFSTIIPV